MQTVTIKGKQYVLINERIKFFRNEPKFENWSLTSEIIELDENRVVMKAIIADEAGNIRATGYAFENKDSSFINKTSFIENCETSAWGRALGNLGIGIDSSIASYEEVKNAMLNQNKETKEEVSDFIDNKQKYTLRKTIGDDKFESLNADYDGKIPLETYNKILDEALAS